MVKDVTWKHVVIIVGFFGTLALLSWTGGDTATFIIVGMGVLGGLGLVAVQSAATKEQTTALKEQTNGNTTKMLEMLETMAHKMAAMSPPKAEDDEKPLD